MRPGVLAAEAAIVVFFLLGTTCTLSFAFAPPKRRHSYTISTPSHLYASSGLYRPFCSHALSRLVESGLFVPSTDIPLHLQHNEAPAKGMPPGTALVKIETRSLLPRNKNVAYARCALLETLALAPAPDDEHDNDVVSTSGIQVMNLVVFPSPHTNLPVWGVDLVSLPGDKHLLVMDVQPMSTSTDDYCNQETNSELQKWHAKYVEHIFEWGGDMPEPAQKFFSPYVLWTRLAKGQSQEQAPPIDIIQGNVWDAFVAHLELYLQLVEKYSSTSDNNNNNNNNTPKKNYQEEYLQYRLMNDPARPMLQSLYGAEWTEQLLTQVLFPKQE
jgi:phycoerythrobilin:ferredoxin oxidoreductase